MDGRTDACMHGWWMDECVWMWVDRLLAGWLVRFLGGWLVGCLYGCVDVDGCVGVDIWMKFWFDGWMKGSIRGWVDPRGVLIYLFYLFIQYLKRCTLLAEIAILPSGPL